MPRPRVTAASLLSVGRGPRLPVHQRGGALDHLDARGSSAVRAGGTRSDRARPPPRARRRSFRPRNSWPACRASGAAPDAAGRPSASGRRPGCCPPHRADRRSARSIRAAGRARRRARRRPAPAAECRAIPAWSAASHISVRQSRMRPSAPTVAGNVEQLRRALWDPSRARPRATTARAPAARPRATGSPRRRPRPRGRSCRSSRSRRDR